MGDRENRDGVLREGRNGKRLPAGAAQMLHRSYRLVALILALSACAIDPRPPPELPVPPAPPQPAQRIPLTVRLPWPSILALAESAVPRCDNLGEDGTCVASDGPAGFVFANEDEWEPLGHSVLGLPVGAKGTFWRTEPLVIRLSGNTVSASLRMLYRTRLAIGGRQVASCGYTDPPRDVTVRLSGSFAYAPGWHIDPAFDIDVVPGSPCTATMFNFNITDAIADAMEGSLQDYAEIAESRIRTLTDMQERMSVIWARIDEPMDIAAAVWLELNPVRVAAGPLAITDNDRYLSIPMVLDARPTVLVGARPIRSSVPLPPLVAGEVQSDFSINVRGLVTYAEASAMLTRILREKDAAETQWLKGIRIERARVSGSGTNVVIAIEIDGLYSGTLYLFGTPRFESGIGSTPRGTLAIDDVDYTIETRSVMLRIGSALYARQIREALQALARWDVSGELQQASTDLRRALNRDLAGEARLTGRLSRFGPGGVRVAPEGLEAWYRVGGALEVIISPF